MAISASVTAIGDCYHPLFGETISSVVATAVSLNRQNRSLKRKSMMPLAHLSPETITEINLDDDEDDDDEEEGEELHAASDVCLSPLSQPTVSGAGSQFAFVIRFNK
ncbi:hypothetical protein EYF80_059263 [Liparis tanakae]|uniref:Uncharacterized protein n=1 Tax=Liparis tanakae TaxID=230148 RepID=A0A4Z2ENW0_9TELE|nr:hypothetical protein EYF80_059263 [Liparis tanakae]